MVWLGWLLAWSPEANAWGARAHGPHGPQVRHGGGTGPSGVWLDVGGQSTRPGAVRVAEAEEAARVVPLIR